MSGFQSGGGPYRHELERRTWALASSDLLKAKEYLDRIEQEDEAVREKTIREALTFAAVVAYCRPFKGSHDKEGKREVRIPSEVVDSLPMDLRELHKTLIRLRDRAWAHSDWALHEPKAEGHRTIVSRVPWHSFSANEVRGFKRLVREVQSRVWPADDEGS